MPPSLWQAATLTALVLHGADLAAIPSLLALPALRGLTLPYFRPAPDGALPAQLPRQLTGLTALALRRAAGDRDPRLRLPTGFATALPMLVSLELCGCSLADVPQEVSALCALRTLLLRYNDLRRVTTQGVPPSLRHVVYSCGPLAASSLAIKPCLRSTDHSAAMQCSAVLFTPHPQGPMLSPLINPPTPCPAGTWTLPATP